jgi:hypothetical protein
LNHSACETLRGFRKISLILSIPNLLDLKTQ